MGTPRNDSFNTKNDDTSSRNMCSYSSCASSPICSSHAHVPILLDVSKVDTTTEEPQEADSVQVEESSVDTSPDLIQALLDDLFEGEVLGDALLEEESLAMDETSAVKPETTQEAVTATGPTSTESEDDNTVADTQRISEVSERVLKIFDIPCTEEHRRRTAFDFSTPDFSPNFSSEDEGVAKSNDRIGDGTEDDQCPQRKPSKAGERDLNNYLGDDEDDSFTYYDGQGDEIHEVSFEPDIGQYGKKLI